jgi:hypothetical protein
MYNKLFLKTGRYPCTDLMARLVTNNLNRSRFQFIVAQRSMENYSISARLLELP